MNCEAILKHKFISSQYGCVDLKKILPNCPDLSNWKCYAIWNIYVLLI